MHPDSILFVSLDSCRYDTFRQAVLPNMKALAPLHRAQAPSHFTYGSHAAMFVGFTPGVAAEAAAFLNPKFARLFRLSYAGHPGIAPPGFTIAGDNIVDGFRQGGHLTLGTAAMGWFDPSTPVSETLRHGFERFWFAGREGVAAQAAWVEAQMADAGDRPVFAFMNIGETHVPYHYRGAPWSEDDNPCVPFQTEDRSAECRMRQTACAEFVDRHLSPLLDAFRDATVLICADHGDCWGEDGLWEHGVSHEMTLTVPLILRYRGAPVGSGTDFQ
ncbi:hypothetical protein [uncultured Brevundimonas sp.]|jgi:hypothetical protein|uniref:hypothetical protein n=1 Tax=uncultured Brevundimonas sp. TaxID=213418 RepID=UPI002621C6A9|nr:hypothetical protein [uncultured Brevundimonas sp.]